MPWYTDKNGVLRPIVKTVGQYLTSYWHILPSLRVQRENIWGYKQNKPSLIADDLHLMGVPRAATLRVLMARGVFKWFHAREQLIAFKDRLKTELRDLQALQRQPARTAHAHWQKVRDLQALQRQPARTAHAHWQKVERRGQIKAVERMRAHIRGICHGQRWTPVIKDLRSWDELMTSINEEGNKCE
jgi:hypothetical protein